MNEMNYSITINLAILPRLYLNQWLVLHDNNAYLVSSVCYFMIFIQQR